MRSAKLTPITITEHFGAYLRDYRRSKHLTQQALTAKLGLSQTHLSGLERGIGWSVDTFVLVWQKLNASPPEVFATCYLRAQRHADLPLLSGLHNGDDDGGAA